MGVFVYELTYPGTWLREDAFGTDDRRNADALLRLIGECIEEAALAVNLFNAAYDASLDLYETSIERDQLELYSPSPRTLKDDLAMIPSGLDGDDRFWAEHNAQQEARRDILRNRWRGGEWPASYVHHAPYMHARSCVYALDTIEKSLRELHDLVASHVDLSRPLDDWAEAFPGLQAVRNSSHHREDRAQVQKFGKPIRLRPVLTQQINAPEGGLYSTGSLDERGLMVTTSDGHMTRLDITEETVTTAGGIVQTVIDLFPWTAGSRRWLPE